MPSTSESMANESVLIVSTNWVGDAVMGMPALQRFRLENPDARITMLTKPATKALWQMHPAVDAIQIMGKPLETARCLRAEGYDCAYIFPNSIRSGFVPWLAGIPRRVAQRGEWRRLMLTDVVPSPNGHQQFEYKAILGVQEALSVPRIKVQQQDVSNVKEMIKQLTGSEVSHFLITLLPGAARGPSKRWPPEHYLKLAIKLRDEMKVVVLLGGGPDDTVSCEQIAKEAGTGIYSLAGKTSVAEWAALLKISDCVVANDSGGMHLATAVGTPVVGIYGLTDPAKTGPLGKSVVLQKSSKRSRDISRSSDEAARALKSIAPVEVFDVVTNLLDKRG